MTVYKSKLEFKVWVISLGKKQSLRFCFSMQVELRRSPQDAHQIKLHNTWGPIKRTKTSPSKMPDSNDADTYKETRAHPENIKVRRVLMHQPWLVSHPNGWSDKGSLFGGPGEMLSRSHALTPRDVYRDVIIAPEYFVNALPKAERQPWRLAWTRIRPRDTSWLTRDTLSTAEIDSFRRLALLMTQTIFVGDDRCKKARHSNGTYTSNVHLSFRNAYIRSAQEID